MFHVGNAGPRRAPGATYIDKRAGERQALPPTARARRAALGEDARRPAARAAPRPCISLKDNPGITIPQIAAKMGIKHNYVYRVLPGLADEGLVAKEGRSWRADEPPMCRRRL